VRVLLKIGEENCWLYVSTLSSRSYQEKGGDKESTTTNLPAQCLDDEDMTDKKPLAQTVGPVSLLCPLHPQVA
jgi:hypothetical protein